MTCRAPSCTPILSVFRKISRQKRNIWSFWPRYPMQVLAYSSSSSKQTMSWVIKANINSRTYAIHQDLHQRVVAKKQPRNNFSFPWAYPFRSPGSHHLLSPSLQQTCRYCSTKRDHAGNKKSMSLSTVCMQSKLKNHTYAKGGWLYCLPI